MADRPAPRGGEDLEELRMQGRLAAGDLHQIGLALGVHQDVQYPLDLRQRAMSLTLDRGVRETDRAGQVAGLVDLYDGQTGMLLVVRAEAAVERAAVIRAGLGRERAVARFQPISLRFPIGEVVADQGLLDAVLAASLDVENARALGRDLRRDQRQACLTQARGLAQEQIGRALATDAVRAGRGRSRSIHTR